MTRRTSGGAPRGIADDEGTLMILTLAYAALALVLILLCADATSMYVAQKRLDALADGTAVAAAEGIAATTGDGGVLAVRLDDARVHRQASLFVSDNGDGSVLISADAPDGSSARVTVASTWHPPVITLFVPRGVALHATATSRTALE